MKITKSFLAVSSLTLFTMGGCILPIMEGQAAPLQEATLQQVRHFIPRDGAVILYDGIRFRLYPNHIIVPDYYDDQSINDMLKISKKLAWKTVYAYGGFSAQSMPFEFQADAKKYFSENGLHLNILPSYKTTPVLTYEYNDYHHHRRVYHYYDNGPEIYLESGGRS